MIWTIEYIYTSFFGLQNFIFTYRNIIEFKSNKVVPYDPDFSEIAVAENETQHYIHMNVEWGAIFILR